MEPVDHAVYAEDRVALTWRLLAVGIGLPLALAAVFVAAIVFGWDVVGPLAAAGAVLSVLWGTALMYRNWPTGIRISADEVRVGAVRSARAAGRTPTVTHQNRGLFTAPLAGVRSMTVVTDPAAIRRLRTSPEFFTLSNRWGRTRTATACKLGVLTAPFMRAALVVELDGGWAHFPTTRRARFFPNTLGRPVRTFLAPEESLTWVLPTRQPERLRAAVDRLLPGNRRP